MSAAFGGEPTSEIHFLEILPICKFDAGNDHGRGAKFDGLDQNYGLNFMQARKPRILLPQTPWIFLPCLSG
jgi:hypothetical protein